MVSAPFHKARVSSITCAMQLVVLRRPLRPLCARLRLRRMHTTLDFSLKVVAAEGLLAADRGGTSDPYTVIRIGKRSVRRTHTVARCLDPVWDADLSFTLEQREMLAKPAHIEVFDEDNFSKVLLTVVASDRCSSRGCRREAHAARPSRTGRFDWHRQPRPHPLGGPCCGGRDWNSVLAATATRGPGGTLLEGGRTVAASASEPP